MIFRDESIPKNEIASFMDRKIVLVKERYKIRNQHSMLKHRYYVEMSSHKSRFYVTIADP